MRPTRAAAATATGRGASAELRGIAAAATAGAALPLLFDQMGLDPALMSAPFITTATDVAGVLIYLRTAAWLLAHTGNGTA